MKCHNFQPASYPKDHHNQSGQVRATLRLLDGMFAESHVSSTVQRTKKAERWLKASL